MTEQKETLEKLLSAAKLHVPFDGWGDVTFNASCEDAGVLRLLFDSTLIGNGTGGASANERGFAMVRQDDGNLGSGYGIQLLHTPGDTSSHTYKIQGRATSSSYALGINRRIDNQNYSLSSSISVMEVSA